jgi:hypothetical protein
MGERYRSCLLQIPFSPLVDPYAELKAFNPGKALSSHAGSLLKYLQSLQVFTIYHLLKQAGHSI